MIAEDIARSYNVHLPAGNSKWYNDKKLRTVIQMLWSEVRRIFPDQFVLVEDLKSRIEDGKLFVEEVSLIRPLRDSKETLDALKESKGKRFIYHTSNENIIMNVVVKPMVRAVKP
ncbi:hypothetical protein [Alicyclobacillus cycloheptanicus]|uniref:Uncharacterized protein n=1 Tax=Alicyclobacillus cycloheptanicus TaxID=1457 RepID=A0ABT9XMA6_9BACL|nr:hypothetical protein [Alicyclobacillus cycloheptanicus]MDQ0191453.1 hypothetical protein [Alicyclobacillus cycloheptanicus]